MLLTAHTLNSKVNNRGTEIACMSHITFEHIKVTENLLADCTSSLRCVGMYDTLYIQEKDEKSLDM